MLSWYTLLFSLFVFNLTVEVYIRAMFYQCLVCHLTYHLSMCHYRLVLNHTTLHLATELASALCLPVNQDQVPEDELLPADLEKRIQLTKYQDELGLADSMWNM